MKKIHFTATPYLMYLTEIPVILLLIMASAFNSSSEGVLKLYPLITVSAAAIVFIFIYLLRFVTLSNDEIKITGLFSSRDKAIINRGKTLILTVTKKGRLFITLFGNDGERPMLDWAQGDDYTPIDINLFKERIYGGAGSIRKTLSFFGVSSEQIDTILSADSFFCEYEGFSVTKVTEETKTDIKIFFTETL